LTLSSSAVEEVQEGVVAEVGRARVKEVLLVVVVLAIVGEGESCCSDAISLDNIRTPHR
jgi:hypothetical protein